MSWSLKANYYFSAIFCFMMYALMLWSYVVVQDPAYTHPFPPMLYLVLAGLFGLAGVSVVHYVRMITLQLYLRL